MAKLSRALKRACDRAKAEAARQEKINSKAFEAGLIAKPEQQTVSGEKTIMDMYRLYVEELKRQDAKNSTGSVGKATDVGTRALYAIARGLPMKVHDFAARTQNKPDIVIVLKDKTRIHVEVKTGQGELVKGEDAWDTAQTMYEWADETYILWYYDVRNFDTVNYDINCIDQLPYIFMKKCDFFDELAKYNGEVDTWLRYTEKAVNLQTVVTSAKKLHFLESLSFNHSYDWIVARDYGELVEK